MKQIDKKEYQEKISFFVNTVGIYILLLPFDCFKIGNIGSLLKIYAIIPVTILILTKKRYKIKYNKLLFSMLLYLSWTFFSCIYSIDIEISFFSSLSLALNIILVIILSSIHTFNLKEKDFLFKCLIFSGWIMVLCFIIFGNKNNWSGRLILSFGEESSQDANYANGYMLCTFAYHIYLAIKEKKIVHFIAASILLGIVIMTGSRGALLAFVICIILVVFLVIKKSKYPIKIIIFSVILIVILYNGFINMLEYLAPELAIRFSGQYISQYGTTGRSEIWKALFDVFTNSGIFRELMGWGYGTTRLLNTTTSIRTAGLVAHNLYIDNLISIGIIGLLLQIFMQIECFKFLWKSKNAMLICTYGAYIAMCLSLSLVNYKPIWCIMMIALILKNNSNQFKKGREC